MTKFRDKEIHFMSVSENFLLRQKILQANILSSSERLDILYFIRNRKSVKLI